MSRSLVIVMPCRHVTARISAQGAQVTYLEALRDAGAEPLLLPIHSSPDLVARMMDVADGLLLPGGEDISPERGGAFWAASAQSHDVARDELELELVRVARATKKPILGICRGVQMLNVAYGGSLIADVSTDNPRALSHMGEPPSHSDGQRSRICFGALHHEVRILAGSWLDDIYDATELEVNSFHHQAVNPAGLGKGLRPCAWASDGTIEAIEATDMSHFVAGVQWHPEMLHYSGVLGWKAFFQHFVDVCGQVSR